MLRLCKPPCPREDERKRCNAVNVSCVKTPRRLTNSFLIALGRLTSGEFGSVLGLVAWAAALDLGHDLRSTTDAEDELSSTLLSVNALLSLRERLYGLDLVAT